MKAGLVKYILMDVEGTTTSIAFVHDELFPFSKAHMRDFFQVHEKTTEFEELKTSIKTVVKEEEGRVPSDLELPEVLIGWINSDRKHPLLKKVQGKIWKQGYEQGKILGHVYDDVPRAFERWKALNINLGIYSSGSEEAQKLLFSHTHFGDLTPSLSNHFDLKVGNKREVNSYKCIAQELKLRPEEILFLSDIKEELNAAEQMGMRVGQIQRTSDVDLGQFQVFKNFEEILS